jgi:hypothetical protein
LEQSLREHILAKSIAHHQTTFQIVYSSSYSVLAMQMSAAYVGLYLPLRFLAYYRPIFRQKTIVLFELYLITWVLMVLNTIAVSISKVGGLYAITFLHVGILFSLVIGLAEHFELPPSIKTRLVRRLRRDSEGREEEEDLTQEATERTPLLNREEAEVRDLAVDEENQYALWIFQLLLAAPFTMILFIQIILLVMGALQQTLADGNSSLSSMWRFCLSMKPINICISLSGSRHSVILHLAPSGPICP